MSAGTWGWRDGLYAYTPTHTRAFTPMSWGPVAYCATCGVLWPCPTVEAVQR